jgi:hypothetical protein
MFDIDHAKLEIDARNTLRHETGLPALSMAVELPRLYNAHRQREWDAYLQSNDQLFHRALRMAASRYRRACDCPASWRPNFVTGMMLQNRVFVMFRKRYERQLKTQN